MLYEPLKVLQKFLLENVDEGMHGWMDGQMGKVMVARMDISMLK